MHPAWLVFRDTRYVRLASISVAPLYHLRGVAAYPACRQQWTKTTAPGIVIDERRAPPPDGRSGYLRMDSVHPRLPHQRRGLHHPLPRHSNDNDLADQGRRARPREHDAERLRPGGDPVVDILRAVGIVK